jgi:hypothetical protein
MVRDEAYRTRKYEAKMDATSISQRFRDEKDSMVEQAGARFAELVLVEEKAKSVAEAAGVPTKDIPFYLNFARQCYRIGKQFSQATRVNEVYYRYEYWLNQGMDSAILTDIASLCGVDLTAYPAAPFVP